VLGGVRLRKRLQRTEGISGAQAALRSLIDSVDCGVLLFGSRGELRAHNQRACELLRTEARRLRELGHFDAVVAALALKLEEPAAVGERWQKRFRNGEPSWDEMELRSPERTVVERFARPVLGKSKKRLGWLEIYRDITGQRLLEGKLFHTQRLAVLGQLVSGVAHELNNPLTSILGYAQLLLRRTGGSEGHAEAQNILEEAERVSRISKNLLLFARETKPERTAVKVNEIVERTLALRNYELRLGNIRVETDLDPKLPLVIADAVQIQQVLLNLIINAEQAIHQRRNEGQIWIKTRHAVHSRVTLEVADDGPGIPPEVVLRIFDPFFTTKPAGMGTGLGLSILYGIVHQHGREVTVGERSGRGAVFTIKLPIAAKRDASHELRDPAEAGVSGQKQGTWFELHGRRILVVEDEPTVAHLIADALGEEGHEVDMVLDSRQGLELIRRGAYDLVICDLRMPHLDGRSFYRELIRRGSSLEHALVFVTGDTLAPRTIEFLEKSGVPHLAKPFLVEELKAVVQRALSVAGEHAHTDGN
jgi:two-component system, NtrC family, sensor kinase